MNLAIAVLRLLRGRLHADAFRLNADGNAPGAQALWAVVGQLDTLINELTRRR